MLSFCVSASFPRVLHPPALSTVASGDSGDSAGESSAVCLSPAVVALAETLDALVVSSCIVLSEAPPQLKVGTVGTRLPSPLLAPHLLLYILYHISIYHLYI